MFGKLFSRQAARSDHPLGRGNLAERVAGIPRGNPERLLFEVDELLETLVEDLAELGAAQALSAAIALDDHAHAGATELLEGYLTQSRRDYLSDATWSILETHAARRFAAFGAVLHNQAAQRDVTITRGQLGCAAARGLRAWSERCKLQRFRYRPVDEASWQLASALLRSATALDVAQASLAIYPGESDSHALREFVVTLYLDLAPCGNLVPPQIEAIDRLLRSMHALSFSQQPPEQSTHLLDLGAHRGPQRLRGAAEPGPQRYFLSVHKARSALLLLAREWRTDASLAWLAGLPITQEQRAALLLALVEHWAPTPPQRGAARAEVSIESRAVFGYYLVRRMIAYSMFARLGKQLKYEGADLDHYYDKRFGRVDEDEREAEVPAPDDSEDAPLPPMEILARLESAGERQQMESWRQVDSSEHGIGVVVPALRPRHAVGALIALRHVDEIEWQAGIIRRIGRDAHGRPSLGIEALPMPSFPALAKLQGDADLWVQSLEGGHGWIDAVVLSREGNELLLPANAFAEGRDIKVRSDAGLWSLRMTKLRDRGLDYDRIEFERNA